MALSNAERQRRYIERLKARATAGEKTVTHIVSAANGGPPDEGIDKDSTDYRLMHATLSLAAALAEIRELDEGREHERFQDYQDKTYALLPLVTQFNKWARDASEEAMQKLLGELEDDTNRWNEEYEAEAIREYINSIELPEETRIALRDRVREAFDADDGRGRAYAGLVNISRDRFPDAARPLAKWLDEYGLPTIEALRDGSYVNPVTNGD